MYSHVQPSTIGDSLEVAEAPGVKEAADDDTFEADMGVKADGTSPIKGSFVAFGSTFVVAAAFHSAMSLCAKIASGRFPTPQIMWSRYSVQLLVTSFILIYRRKSPFGPAGLRLMLVSRGLVGMLSQGCHILSVRLLPLADAVSLHTVYPVLTALLAPHFLGETLTITAILAALMASIGCIFIARGKNSVSSARGTEYSGWSLGVTVALLGALFASLTYIIIRKIMRNTATPVDPEVVVWFYSATSVFFLTLALPFTVQEFVFSAPHREWSALVAVGLISVVEQTLVTVGFRGLPAGIGTLLLTLETGFAFLFGLLVLQEPVSLTSGLGAFCIAVAVGSTALQTLSATGHAKSDADIERMNLAAVERSESTRSEERRVGKECRSRWSPYH
eukprot:TRINITY_DN74035_c0_g1_i1.p1 TRINITY_DN74035_c0_g1~~TRINITY_DN74035_c0_g1_i1.p1  ORF type:complete len:390 (-),score=33.16 TRINITY_DN74035_c0_g1_i1:17-1186(-)